MGDADHEQELGLVRRARAGDRAAFSALVDRYWDPLRRWLTGLSGRPHAAEDLTQEAFLKAWTGLPRLAAPETFRVWLFRIARNEYLALARSPRAADHEPLSEAEARTPGPAEQVAEREAAAALRAAVERLPEAYRAAYLLWTHEELPYAEIARVLDVTEETARWRVCDARRRLAAAVAPYLGDERR